MTGDARVGRPADTGFLLLPLAALVFSTAALLATLSAGTLLVPPGCGLGDILTHPCSSMVNTLQMTFNIMIIPGAVMFLWLSRWHRRRTRPLDKAVFPAAVDVVGEVLPSVRLPVPVEVVLGPWLGRRAFTGGTGAKPYVALGPELLTLPAKGPAGRQVLEAVLRHELAHVQNLDLLRLQFATSLRISTRASALLTALLLLAQQIWSAQPIPAGTAVGVALRAVLLAVVAELVVRAFFRAREHEADLRAAAGTPGGLRAALHAGRERPRGLRERLLARHPTAAARLAGLADDRMVLALPLGQLFGAGLFTAVVLANSQLLVDLLLAADLLDRPRPDATPWLSLSIVALSAVPVGVFLALGSWRDAQARRLAGRPPRPALAGAVFGVALLAGMYLAPYPALVPTTASGGAPPHQGPPLVTGLVVCVSGAIVLCWWLTALAGRSAPGGLARAVLLPVAVLAGVALLQLIWEVTGWLVEQKLGCRFSPVGCGPLAAPRIVLSLLAEPWAVVPLTLATLTLVAVVLHRYGAVAVNRWWVAGVVAAGIGMVVVLPRLSLANALTLEMWESLHYPLGIVDLTMALQVALLAAVVLTASLPRTVAGPVAATAALVVIAVGLAVWTLDWVGHMPLQPDEYGFVAGQYLGAAYGLVLPAVVAVLAVRSGWERLDRRRAGGTAAPPMARRPGDDHRADQPAGSGT
ncbi:M48 family metalloprotease [Micromonospora sp. WMMA1363]|uniref:M48 family metalloprotease n=1 Tax=Micromonospora sp. WMMA1363 TaxID=3053985 RepID=UPI00259D2E3B|nr:M48 family metalloprotease [Micromonospora sp. WMMA1363]MDM4718565.1 M48 family metalloprotease [Micromonospora sp. WMMA1363]